jgi:hypothetical protein
MRYLFSLCFILFFAMACKNKQTLKDKQQELDNGKLNDKNVYTATEIGWTIHVPQGWDVRTKKEIETVNEKGKEIIEESLDAKVDNSGLKYLINLKKDPFNNFLSTIEPFDEQKDGSYSARNKATYEAMQRAYDAQKIHYGCEEGMAQIDGLRFDVLTCKIYSPNKNDIIMTQEMYSRLINGYDFSMTLIYNNEDDRQLLLDMIHAAHFSIRE